MGERRRWCEVRPWERQLGVREYGRRPDTMSHYGIVSVDGSKLQRRSIYVRILVCCGRGHRPLGSTGAAHEHT